MAESLFDPSWYRLAALKLRLRAHAELHRQQFRGQVWYVLQDHQSGRFHRISPAANLFISLMDGSRTLDEIWNLTGTRFEDDPPTQAEAIRLLAQLHSNDLLQGDVPPDFAELAERAAQQSRRELLGKIKNPMALRVPLFDPDRLLDRIIPLFRPLFTVWGFIGWLVLIATGIVLAALHWTELTSTSTDTLISAGNIALTLATYPVVKLLHETGHALATKAWGGHVHEMGVMFLVLMPAPYVDATAATSFPEKWRRIVVSGAGIMVEFGLAALAMIFWVNAEPGLARAAAFNVMLIGSVSTIFFNGNPLLRYDAFYILSDLIEIPNLATRANRYVIYLIERHLFGIESAESPVTAPGEARWFLGYAVASWCYRILLSLGIALLIATKFFWIGTVLALMMLTTIFVVPLAKGVHFLFTSPKLRGHGARAFGVTGAVLAGLAILLFAIPLPYATTAEGVVWPPAGAEVRVTTSGDVAAILAAPDSIVTQGTPLLQLEDPQLSSTIALLKTQRDGLNQQLDNVRFTDRVRAGILGEQIRSIDGSLADAQTRQNGLLIRAPSDGRFILPGAPDLQGRFLRQGSLAGYVLAAGHALPVRTVVPQSDVDLVRGDTQDVTLLYSTTMSRPIEARIGTEVPAAQTDLPAPALAREGGGDIVTHQDSDGTTRAIEGLFVFDVMPTDASAPQLLGSRVYVRFRHDPTPIAGRIGRALRQVFLSYFDV